jgi:hypothetical protein
VADKGSARLERECKRLAIDGYPGAIPRAGMVSLLAGTDDDTAPVWQEWAGMVWDSLELGKKWQSSELQRIELVLRPIEPASAAAWLTSIGEKPDTLSWQVKLWLDDHLDKPGKPRQNRQRRLDLLEQVIEQLKAIDRSLDTKAMPGTRGDLLEYCQKRHAAAFNGVSVNTFKGDLPGICSFPVSARRSSYYRDQLAKLS